jgi:hypothetical protein
MSVVPSTVLSLWESAGELLLVAEDALSETSGGTPDRSYVSASEPAFDCCPFLTVYVSALTEDTTGVGPGGVAGGHRTGRGSIILATYQILAVRCAAPYGNKGVDVPTPEAIEAVAQLVTEDGWSLWNRIRSAVKCEEIFGTCSEVYFDGGVPIPEQGGCVGWRFTIRAALPGIPRPCVEPPPLDLVLHELQIVFGTADSGVALIVDGFSVMTDWPGSDMQTIRADALLNTAQWNYLVNGIGDAAETITTELLAADFPDPVNLPTPGWLLTYARFDSADPQADADALAALLASLAGFDLFEDDFASTALGVVTYPPWIQVTTDAGYNGPPPTVEANGLAHILALPENGDSGMMSRPDFGSPTIVGGQIGPGWTGGGGAAGGVSLMLIENEQQWYQMTITHEGSDYIARGFIVTDGGATLLTVMGDTVLPELGEGQAFAMGITREAGSDSEMAFMLSPNDDPQGLVALEAAVIFDGGLPGTHTAGVVLHGAGTLASFFAGVPG